jgi:hypothetical protein
VAPVKPIGPIHQQLNINGGQGDLLFLIEPAHAALLRSFFGISPDFPIERLLSRSEKQKAFYYTSEPVLQRLNNDPEGKVKVVNAGVRVFDLSEDTALRDTVCKYRISQGSIHIMLPFLSKQVVELESVDELKMLLHMPNIHFSEWTSQATQEKIEALSIGSCVFTWKLQGHEIAIASRRLPSRAVGAIISTVQRESLQHQLEMWLQA